jgi:hypothetical protein
MFNKRCNEIYERIVKDLQENENDNRGISEEDICRKYSEMYGISYNKFVRNEQILDDESIKTISPEVEKQIRNFDFDNDKFFRQKLFEKYSKIFDKYNLIKLPSERYSGAFCYPLSTKNEEILSKLSQFILLRLWKEIPKNYPEYEFLNNTIALPLNDEIYCEKICTALSKIPKQ